jgi:hypothetical protein
MAIWQFCCQLVYFVTFWYIMYTKKSPVTLWPSVHEASFFSKWNWDPGVDLSRLTHSTLLEGANRASSPLGVNFTSRVKCLLPLVGVKFTPRRWVVKKLNDSGLQLNDICTESYLYPIFAGFSRSMQPPTGGGPLPLDQGPKGQAPKTFRVPSQFESVPCMHS